MDNFEWYLEYEIRKDCNRPGLLGGVASLMGLLSINIVTINGVAKRRRGMLIRADNTQKIDVLKQFLDQMDNITITALRRPGMADRLAIRHGCYLERDLEQKQTYRFTREDMGLLVDFMGELFKKTGHQLIGIRGLPRVGKSESIVAASVCSNKRWTFLSSTLLKQTIRRNLSMDEFSSDHVYIIDGIVSTHRATEEHSLLVQDVLRMKATKVIEHPDIFVQMTEMTLDDFDYIIELRDNPDEEIIYELTEPENSSI